MTNFEQKVLEDKLLSECYLNFEEYLVDDYKIDFISRFALKIPIKQNEEIEYVDDNFIKRLSRIQPEHLEIIKSRLIDGKTLQAVANDFKLTRERIRQIEAGAIKKIVVLMDRQLLADTLDKIKEQSLIYIDQLPFKDEKLKHLFVELLSQSKHRVHFDKELMALIDPDKISFLKIVDRIEEFFIDTNVPIFSQQYLIDTLQACFPNVKNPERIFFLLLDKQMLSKVDEDLYFFQYLYKRRREKIEFLFSLYPEGLEVYKQIDYIKEELDRFFPNVFDESDRKRGIATAVGNSDYLYLWAWGKYIHIKFIQAILENFDFTNVLEYLDQHVSEVQIDLNLCFESFKSELVNASIPDKNALHTCLKLKYPDEYTYQKAPWISKAGSERMTRGETLKNLLIENRIYSLDELVSAMHSKKIPILQLIDHTNDVITVDINQYVLKKYIYFPERLLEKMTKYANEKVEELDYFYIDLITDTFADELIEFSKYDIRTLVLDLLKKASKNKKFNISNTRLVHKNYPLTNDSLNFHVLTEKFIIENDSISLNQLSNFHSKRGLTPTLVMAYFLNSKIKRIVRIDRETFTSLEKLGLSSQTIENINLLVENSFENEQQIEDIINSLKLPVLSLQWNRYLLTDIMDNQRFLFAPSRENPLFIRKRDVNDD